MTIEIREALPGEELAIAEIHVRSWQEAYAGLMPAEFLAALDPRDRAARYTLGAEGPEAPTTLVALEDDAMLGFVTFRLSHDADAPDLGEVAALYVDPDRHRGGVGRLLMSEARRRLREEGFADALLWVLDGNDRARRFYEGEGWKPDGARREENPYDIVSRVSRLRRPL